MAAPEMRGVCQAHGVVATRWIEGADRCEVCGDPTNPAEHTGYPAGPHFVANVPRLTATQRDLLAYIARMGRVTYSVAQLKWYRADTKKSCDATLRKLANAGLVAQPGVIHTPRWYVTDAGLAVLANAL